MPIAAHCAPEPGTVTAPTSLKDCYLNVALKKQSADMAYVAKQLCEAVFSLPKPSLVRLDPNTGRCEEWWLDARGRYENSRWYCSFEAHGQKRWVLACQDKDKASRFAWLDLREVEAQYETASAPKGVNLGSFFTSLGACISHRAEVPGSN